MPRGGSAKHADPYWFSPDGFRFRSVKEIDRWREAGWDLGAMPRSALQGKKFDGLGVSQISRQLFISDSTTKTHISKLYDKLGAGNRAQALMTALRLGLLEAPDDTP